MPPITELSRIEPVHLARLEKQGIFTTGILLEVSETTTRTSTPRRAAARIRATMSSSVRYGFITSSRSRAPSICAWIACVAATKPPGITWARAIGVEPRSDGSGK